MMIFKKAIPRRAFLRGIGTTLALPLLDSMIPAFGAASDTAAKEAIRSTFIYIPNGAIMDNWTPATEGAAFELSPILKPLAPFREQLLVLSGLNSNEAWGRPGEVSGEHPRAATAWLTGVHVNQASREPLASVSVDQLIAREFKKHTQLASLELGIESSGTLGTCDGDCSYRNTICWSNETTPLPMENQPRAVFERLFGDSASTSQAERLARIRKKRSILDFITRDTARLLGDLGPSDRVKINQYLEALRDVERRIQMAEEQSSRELPALQRPAGIPATFTEHVKLMMDMQVLAYQTDMTRVSTLQVGHEQGNQPFPEIGITDPFHPLTHHQGDQEKIAKVIRINTFHAEILTYLLERLRSTADGDGSLLDHSMIVYGSGLSDGNKHVPVELPTLFVGGKSVGIRGGRHIRYPKGTPLANLYMTMLDKLGVPIEKFGDSTGKLNSLSI
ncbi:MAG: DUF1552 domain-containing protein [Acidobacteria bacterium]|nr:DUF1552 domain-containing protein [Acidobacteriota bacterium]